MPIGIFLPCRTSTMTTSFHQMVSLCILFFVCAPGCHLCHHFGHGCNRCEQRSSGCGEDACTCAAPLCQSDGIQCQRCHKHRHLGPMQRLAAKVHRASPNCLRARSACSCGGGCGSDCVSGGATGGCGCGFCGESVVWQQGYVSPSCFACDPMTMPMTDGWYSPGASISQGGCGCGESGFSGEEMYSPANVPGIAGTATNVRPQGAVPSPPRMFPPADQQIQDSTQVQEDKTPPRNEERDAPAMLKEPLLDNEHFSPAQDVTPGEPVPAPLPDLPRNAPVEFDPLGENGAAPNPSPVVDPTSYQLPRLPPIPERRHGTSPAPVARPTLHIPTTAESFRR